MINTAETKEAAQEKPDRKYEPVCDVIKKRKLGDRRDGRRVRSLSPMSQLVPYIMKERSDAQNHIMDTIEIDRINEYVNEKRRKGLAGFGLMHVLIAAYVRAVAEYPGLNRFVNGQRVYTRGDYIEVSLTIKREMTLLSPDTVVKLTLRPDAVAEDVYYMLTDIVNGYREVKDSGFDKTAKMLNYIPGFVKRGAFAMIRFMDYFGWLPRALTRVSPFHSSMFITSMGSLGIPPIYHHLYNLGNVPIFISFGAKYKRNVLQKNGTVVEHSYCDIKIVTDERICDGYYFASGFKYMRKLFKDPRVLDVPPAEVKQDID